MNESHVPPTALEEPPRPSESEAGSPPAAPPAAASSEWTGGRITALVIGSLLALVALGLLGAGGTGVWADLTQREAGYATTDEHAFSTSGSALATERTHLGSAGVEWLYSPGLLGKVRIRVTPTASGRPLFVGIGRATDVDRYLAGVNHTLITDFFGGKAKTVGGGAARSAPGRQGFWVASTTGSGERKLFWKPHKGSWTVVVMNADAKPGLAVRADLGAKVPALIWIALGLLVAGAVFAAGAGLLIVNAVRSARQKRKE